MAKKQTVNGATALNPVISSENADILASMKQAHPPIVPAKTEAQLIMEQEIERLKAENAALKQRPATTGRISLRVSEKGALSVYGLMRFPVTLYQEQWQTLLGMADEIKAFIAANSHSLKRKGE